VLDAGAREVGVGAEVQVFDGVSLRRPIPAAGKEALED